ncbi:hypothetical protein BDV41DRAFT_526056 [Aspergillus transmontanensis]|uniref:Uncharacterized protein n=1 Tax=Aspergillus transmontanensis TaxID=1034304 RepID=A0A5N6WAR0_9EURO|nr:hypothetical protein BDV41DRAFT_526056 [Aspergillus transmontanensis]
MCVIFLWVFLAYHICVCIVLPGSLIEGRYGVQSYAILGLCYFVYFEIDGHSRRTQDD